MSNTQDAPIEDGSDDATNEQAVQGILEQVRADIGMGHTHESPAELLRERFTQSGVQVSEERLSALAAELQGA